MNNFISSLPNPMGYGENPTWIKFGFSVNGKAMQILEYSENFIGWSDDLTHIHESLVGSAHPIDVASRRVAIQGLQNLNLPSESIVLEIGCSSGFLIKEISSRFPSLCLVGADVVREPLFRLAKECPTIPLLRFDLLQSPIPAQSVRAVIMLNVLEHIESDEVALKKIYSMLSPGGALILEVPASPLLYGPYDAALGHFRRYTKIGLCKKMTSAGFLIERSSHLGFLLFPFFFAVKMKDKILRSREKADLFASQAQSTSKSKLLEFLLKIELKYLSCLSFPFGIRTIVVARKPY